MRLLPASLAGRLVLALALVQSAVVIGGMAAWMLASPYVTWDDVAAETASGLALAAIEAGPAGPRIAPGGALGAYAARRDGLEVAVLLAGEPLPGSSAALAGALARLGPFLPADGRLALPLPGGGAAMFRQGETALGPAVAVTAGNRFRARDDIGTFFSVYVVQLVPMFGPAILAAVLAVPLAIRRTLSPLRAAARAAGAMDLRSLDQRLGGQPLPLELRPFMEAIDGLLARIEDGVRRQRLFTANAAHELRTPVAILQARVDMLPGGAPCRAELGGDVRRITLLLDQLLAVARLGQADAAAAEAVDLAACAATVVGDMAPLAIRSGRQLALEGQAAGPVQHGAARAIESALANLVDNALRAEPEGGTVTVRVLPGGGFAVIDHGAGVAAADQPFLFEPFWRKEDGSRGSGLGLAIVGEVARLHGGTVAVEPTPGGGATFVLNLPAMRFSPPAAQPSPSRGLPATE